MVVVGGGFGGDLLDRQAARTVDVIRRAVVEKQRQGPGAVPSQVAFRSGDGLGGAQAGAVVGVGFVNCCGTGPFGTFDSGEVSSLVVAVGGGVIGRRPLLDPVVPRVGNPDVAARVERQSLGF